MDLDKDTEYALSIAKRLIDAGIPVFAAPPIPGKPGEYQLPSHWEKTVASPVNLERWRPGWALAAVGGHAADFLDVDPRNGGNESLADIVATGHMPRSFGQQATPSGGTHDIISATGLRKSTNFLPGLDLQAGAADGVGRGFVWIAPTVRKSKNPDDNGALRAYRWVTKPDVDGLHEYAGCDDSTTGIITRVQAKRSTPKQRQPAVANLDDPFMIPSDAFRMGERCFTPHAAQEFVRPHLMKLRGAQNGEINNQLNATALTVAHFVPTFWSEDQARALLADALAYTAYDGKTWQAEDTIQSAFQKADTDWKATLQVKTPLPLPMETKPGEESFSTLERMRARLVTAAQLAAQPAPEPLIYGLLDRDSEAWMIGAPGCLKSFIALDMAAHVGRGHEWQGHKVKKGKVLYVAAEGTRGMVMRTRAWIKKNGDMEVIFLPYPVQVQSADGQWDALVEIAREEKPDLIVLDTQARISVGLEENSATDMGILIAAIGELRRACGACILVIHHTGRRGGDARGSSALDGAQDTELKVVRAEPRNSLQCKLLTDKQKDMAELTGNGIPLWLSIVDLGTDEHTGRELSSLVLDPHDPFRAAQGSTVVPDVDTEAWTRIPVPQEWTQRLKRGKIQRRALQVLADHAHSRGLTKAETLRIVSDRWSAPSKRGTWDAVWSEICDLGDLVVNVGGERWALDQVELSRLRAQG